jgi:trehalose-6-phosphate hydrolase
MLPAKHKLLHVAIFLYLSCITAWPQDVAGQKIWWKETVFYQIYMPSYADSNGDGYGDFKGITRKLDYLNGLGIKGIWLTPFLKSPKVDNGYDVADYYAIDPTYGTQADFEAFLKEAHKRGIKVIMDMVLNHTSTDSKWFQESRKSKDNLYRDYYIWKDRPNNWESFFGGTAWQKDTTTNQYYYHKFDVRMADLNWGNPKVVNEVQNVLRFWLDAGVDGFRLDVINFLTTDGITQDNPVTGNKQEHIYDIDQKSVKDAMRAIKSTVSAYPGRFIVGEIGSDKIDVLKQYQRAELLDVVFNFNFGSIPDFSAEKIFAEMQSMETHMAGYPTLFFSSHDMPRMIDRLAGGNPKRAEALAALLLTVKGVPFIYYGDEIGMHNTLANSFEDIKDIQGVTHYKLALAGGKNTDEALAEGNLHNRDKSRSPMQWDSSRHAGFSVSEPWIKVNTDYALINAETLGKQHHSILNAYIKLIALRNNEKALQYGLYTNLEHNGGLITFTRTFNNESITVLINFGAPTKVKIALNAKILSGDLKIATDGYLIYKVVL